MSKSRHIAELAPPPPLCFLSGMEWRSYLTSAAEGQKDSRGPLIFKAGEPVRFNYRFRYCRDCSHERARHMAAIGKCDPHHVYNLRPVINVVAMALQPEMTA